MFNKYKQKINEIHTLIESKLSALHESAKTDPADDVGVTHRTDTEMPEVTPTPSKTVFSPAPEPTPPLPTASVPTSSSTSKSSIMDMITTNTSKPSILSEGFAFRGELVAKGAIHVEGSLNGQIQVDEITIGSRGQVEGVITCSSLHIKGKFSGTATCTELIVTSSASVDGHIVYQTLSVQKGALIKGELLLVK